MHELPGLPGLPETPKAPKLRKARGAPEDRGLLTEAEAAAPEVIVVVLTMKAPEPGAVLYPRYRSSQPVRYVLETNAGWFEKHGIIAGESVQGFRGPAGSKPR